MCGIGRKNFTPGVVDENNGSMEVYKLEECEEDVAMLVGMGYPEEAKMQQGGQPKVRAAKSSDSRKGE